MLDSTLLDALKIEPDPSEVLRYLGYPRDASPDERVASRVYQAIELSRPLLRCRGIFAVYRVVRHGPNSLTLSGGSTFTGSIGEFLGNADRAAVFVATAGREVVQLAEDAARRGDCLGGLVYHALGAELAEAVVRHIVDELRGCLALGEALTLRYSPGYCGISLAQQKMIFELVDAAKIGVELLPTFIMKPVKSVSGLIGLGPAEAVTAYGNPCDRCSFVDCRMRR